MSEIILDSHQAEIFEAAQGDVVLRTQEGKVLGRCLRLAWSSQEIADAEKRLDSEGPWRSTAEVVERLQSTEPQ